MGREANPFLCSQIFYNNAEQVDETNSFCPGGGKD